MSTAVDDRVQHLLTTERVVAIIRNSAGSAADLADTAGFLSDAGVHLIEFPLTSPAAIDALRIVAERRDGTLVGAGTVRTVADVDAVADAGASFIVTPAFDPLVVRHADRRGLSTLPGALTPTEISSAVDAGATAVKVFPAGPLGPEYIAALMSPFPRLRTVPTGGISLDDVPRYYAAGAAAVGLGSDLVGDGSRTEIRKRVARLRDLSGRSRLADDPPEERAV